MKLQLKIKNFIIFEFLKTTDLELNIRSTIIIFFNKQFIIGTSIINSDKIIDSKNFSFNYHDSAYSEKKETKIYTPQHTISINIENNIGVSEYTQKIASDHPSVKVILFGKNSQNLSSVPAKLITSLNPEYGVAVDGQLCAGTLSGTDQDITISSDISSYSRIFNDIYTSSTYQMHGNKLFCASMSQLSKSYWSKEYDILGRTLSIPYTPMDKMSQYQFSSTIIEDPSFTLKLDGNSSIEYEILSPGCNGITAGTPNLVKMSFYLYKIQEAIAKAPVPIVKKSWFSKFKLKK